LQSDADVQAEPGMGAEADLGTGLAPAAESGLEAELAAAAEPGLDADIGGEPADPVPLAEMPEVVGEQPVDPRPLALGDQGGEPSSPPEDPRPTEAELAAEPEAFQPGALEALPELDPEPAPPPPAPAAPRIVVPRPPPAPPGRPAVASTPSPRP